MFRNSLIIGMCIAAFSTLAQTRFVFSSSAVSTSNQNEECRNLIVKKSYHMPYYIEDSISDTTALKMVDLIHSNSNMYCFFYKKDTTKLAIEMTKSDLPQCFGITVFWRNGNIRRSSGYNKNYLLSGWVEYYQNGELKLNGQYKNGEKNGNWKYYDSLGHKIITEKYKKNVLIKSTNEK